MEAGAVIELRLKNIEENQKELIDWRRRVDQGAIEQKAEQRAMREDISDIRRGQEGLVKKQDALMKSILGAAGAITLAAITFALTVLAGTGKI